MKKTNFGYGLAFLSLMVISLAVTSGTTFAAFNQNRVVDDAVFDNVNSMNAGQIDSFLNSFPNSCISPNSGFRAIDPIGYNPTDGYKYGGYVTAGQVVYDAAQTYGINPQVILTTLQKEQSLVVGGSNFCENGDYNKYTAAVGYGCPDSGGRYSYNNVNLYQRNGNTVTSTGATCVNSASKAGFSQQVIRGAWLLKFGQQRALGRVSWAVIKGDWNNSDDPQSCYGGPMTQGTFQRCPGGAATYYDGYTTIDGSAVHMESGATAALYWYTPHFSGNQHFVSIFEQTFRFGSVTADQAQFVGQSDFPTITQGSAAPAYLKYKNVSSANWYDDVTAAGASANPVHLAGSGPVNRGSAFASGWPASNRPNTTFSKVYEADGVTLASNQHVVAPGQIAEFDFTFRAPPDFGTGYYQEFFQPILEGSSNWNMGGVAWQGVTIRPITYSASFVGQSAYPTIITPQSSNAYLKYKNSGATTWYDDITAAAAGYHPIHLATSNSVNRASIFGSGWPSKTRPGATFSKVYEADGVTLASNQHVVAPGQIAEFDFTFKTDQSTQPGYYREFFRPYVEGAANWNMNGEAWLGVTVQAVTYRAAWAGQSNYPTIAGGSSSSAYLRYKNDGNVLWYDDTSAAAVGSRPVHLAGTSPINRGSAFGRSWPALNRPANVFSKVYEADGVTLASNQHVVAPGQIAEFDFDFSIPTGWKAGDYQEYFQPILEGAPNWNMGGAAWLKVTVR